MLRMLPNQVRCCFHRYLYRTHHLHPLRLVLLPLLERVHPLVVRPRMLVPPLPNFGWIKLRYFMVDYGHKHYQNYALHLIDLGLGFSCSPCYLEFVLLYLHLQER